MVILEGVPPNNFSNENILPPMHSAISALATKNAANPMKSLVGLSFRILCIMMSN